jgi:hypothetical protein
MTSSKITDVLGDEIRLPAVSLSERWSWAYCRRRFGGGARNSDRRQIWIGVYYSTVPTSPSLPLQMESGGCPELMDGIILRRVEATKAAFIPSSSSEFLEAVYVFVFLA